MHELIDQHKSCWLIPRYKADFENTKDKNEWAMKDILQVPSHLTAGLLVS